MLQNKQWFLDRIGKRIYRDKNNPPCLCDNCKYYEENGNIITSKNHAEYLYTIQLEFEEGGHLINFRDAK